MNDFTSEENKIAEEAVQYVKEHAKELVQEFSDPSTILPDNAPASVFMAGSPGAGKTEFSKWLIDALWEGDGTRVCRIDPDEIRVQLPQYTGGNAYLFQGAVSTAVNKIHDAVIKQEQNFILDGTFANFDQARSNVDRSLAKGRSVSVFFIYQDPIVAWEFTKRREAEEGRRIEKETFVEQFFASQDTVNKIKEEFGKQVRIFLVQKNFLQEVVDFDINIQRVDHHINCKYSTREELYKALA